MGMPLALRSVGDAVKGPSTEQSTTEGVPVTLGYIAEPDLSFISVLSLLTPCHFLCVFLFPPLPGIDPPGAVVRWEQHPSGSRSGLTYDNNGSGRGLSEVRAS